MTHNCFAAVSPFASLPMIRPSQFLPQPPHDRLKRRQYFSGAIHGSPVLPSAPTDNAAPAQAGKLFDDSFLPEDVQKVIASFFDNPHEAHTVQELRAALVTLKAMSEVNRAFHRFALPLRQATFLRLFGLGCIKKTSFESPPLQYLLRTLDLEGMVAHGLSGLQCLSDLVSVSLGEDPGLTSVDFNHWIELAKKSPGANTKLPYHVLPTLIAARLGQMLLCPGVVPAHALMLMNCLVIKAQDKRVPHGLAMPVLIEAALVILVKEISTSYGFDKPAGWGGDWMYAGGAQVTQAMQAIGGHDPFQNIDKSLRAMACLLAPQRPSSMAWGFTEEDVLISLEFLANCPYPLIGSLAEALDIIQRMDLGNDPHVEDLLAHCAEKRASVRLLGPMPE